MLHLTNFRSFAVFLLTSALLLSINGCSNFEFPGVYKLPIPQGNVVKQEMLDKLQIGMSKQQVRFILGSPLLLNSFNDNLWGYHFSLLKDDSSTERKRLEVLFDNTGKLSEIRGDLKDVEASIEAPSSEAAATAVPT